MFVTFTVISLALSVYFWLALLTLGLALGFEGRVQ